MKYTVGRRILRGAYVLAVVGVTAAATAVGVLAVLSRMYGADPSYSDEEIAAAVRAKVLSRDSKVIYYAGGPYWPAELERRARAHRKLADAEDLIAAALRREQTKDGTS